MNAGAALNGAPEAVRQKESEEKRCRAKSDQIPDAASAEERLDQKEDHGAENRPFECPQTADEGHENQGGPPAVRGARHALMPENLALILKTIRLALGGGKPLLGPFAR